MRRLALGPERRQRNLTRRRKMQRGLRLHQRHFKILIGHQQRLDRPAQIAVASRNDIIDCGLISDPGGSPFTYTHLNPLLSHSLGDGQNGAKSGGFNRDYGYHRYSHANWPRLFTVEVGAGGLSCR
jgi:hypothetical protein